MKMKTEIWEYFNKWYDYFYGHDDYGTEVYEKEQLAIDTYNDLYKCNTMFRTFAVTMQQVRKDCFTSDKEIAAFMLAYEDLEEEITRRYNGN